MGLLERWAKKKQDAGTEAAAPATEKAAPTEKKTTAKKEGAAKKTRTKAPAAPVALGKGGVHEKVLLAPLLSEKILALKAMNKYAFEVAVDAKKKTVALAVEERYGVKPTAVHFITNEGKKVRSGRAFGRRSDCKKAIVTLPSGSALTLHEGV